MRAVTTLVLILIVSAAASTLGAQTTPADFGDAPSPYPIAVHQFALAPEHKYTCMGRRVSDDSAGNNPVGAAYTGDSYDDGVWMYQCRKGATCNMILRCWSAVDDDTTVGVWMDFNDDGDWDDPGEHPFVGVGGMYALNGSGGWSSYGGGGFRFMIPASAVGTSVKCRVRMWTASLNTAPFDYGGFGSPGGTCIGGEVEDYDFPYDGAPELFIYNERGEPVNSGDSIFVGQCPLNSIRTYGLFAINQATTTPLSVTEITITNVTHCSAIVTTPTAFSISPPQNYAFINLSIVITETRASFDLAITSNDTTGNESPFVLHFTCGRGLDGTYTISNANPTPAPDFTDIGEAFDELELCGVVGDVIFEIEEGPTPYASNASYALGSANHNEADRVQAVAGLDYQYTATFRPLAGQRPKITGSGANFRYGDTIFSATLAINAPHVTVEGLDVSGGQDFGIALFSVWPFDDDSGLQSKPDFTRVRQCMVHDCVGGPGIALVSSHNVYDVRIEKNMLWNCHVGSAYIQPTLVFGTGGVLIPNASGNQLSGVISICNTSTDVWVKDNTILANTAAPTGSFCACLCFYDGNGGAEMSGNLMVQTTAGQPVMYFFRPSDIPPICDHNGYQAAAAPAPFCVVDQPRNTYSTFASWQNSGVDPNGIVTTDVKFRSATAPIDVHLKATSPMVDKYTIVGASTDVDGEPRPQRNGMDIGADEVPPDPAMIVKRGQIAIPDGSTDNFGASITPNTPTDFIYTITNMGQGPLLLTGTPRVVLTATPAFTAMVSVPPPSVVPVQGSVQLIVTVTSPTGAFSLGISLATNDPGADPFNWQLICNTAPTITVTCRGQPVADNQVLSFPFGTTVESMGLVITLNDSDNGQYVSLSGTVSSNVMVGIVNSEFCSLGLPTPYNINPTSGAMTINQGSSHLVTLMAADGLSNLFFIFTIVGEPAATLIDVLEGGPNGPPIQSGASPVGTSRSFAMRDIKAGPSAAAEFALKNVCGVPVSVGIPQLSGLHDQDFHVNTGGNMGLLQPGQSMSIYVTFDPTDVGHRVAILELYHAGMNHPNPFVLALEGDGVDLPPITITSVTTLPEAQTNEQYGQVNLSATGGLAPYTWMVGQGGLPEGIRVTHAGAVYGFTTGNAGNYRVGIRVRDIMGNETMREFDIHVLPPNPPRALPNDGLSGRDNGSACSATEGGAPWWLLSLPMFWMVWRIRRREA